MLMTLNFYWPKHSCLFLGKEDVLTQKVSLEIILDIYLEINSKSKKYDRDCNICLVMEENTYIIVGAFYGTHRVFGAQSRIS